MTALRHAPTSIRLSPETRERLAFTAKQQGRSQSGIAELAIKSYIDSLERQQSDLTIEQKLGFLRDLSNARPADGGRSTNEIDAAIRDMRRDRF